MEVEFLDDRLEKLEADASYTTGYSGAVVRAFRKKMLFIREAEDERDLRAMKSFHFEKLLGSRRHQSSIRLNDLYRLILEIATHSAGKVVRIVGIEDYH